VARTQQNGVVERRNRTLVEAAQTMLIFSKAILFLWAEAINTACYTQNRSLICLRYNKTPYELMQNKKPDLSFLYIFGSLCYPTNDHEDLGKLNAKADIRIFVGYAPAKKAFRIYNRKTRIIFETIHVTFDELTAMAFEQFSLEPGLHFMTLATPSIPGCSINKIPSSQEQQHSPIISQGFEESPKTLTFHDDSLNESSLDSTSQGSSSIVIQIHTPLEHLGRWTKDHPIANVIGDPSRSVSIRKQLKTNAMWCYFDSFLTLVEPKNFKQAMTKPSWIDAIGIFINQSKYASEIVKKYGLNSTNVVDTPMIENKKLDEDLQGKPVDATLYRGIIGSLMYLTASRPDLIYAVCLCAQYQAKPTKNHLQAVKRIFRYLNGTINMGFWYSKDTDLSLTTYAYADHTRCQDTRRSTSRSAQFLGDKIVSWSSRCKRALPSRVQRLNILPYQDVVLKSYGCVHS
nr:uncharacterized mitochondrial protein AtMg00810-like [Tanacetum cinerariifolium]